MNGSFLLLARAIGRGGSATSHLKRYDIDKVFHKAMAGGHPRETIEASFDIVHDGIGTGHIAEAEALHVAHQVMAILPPNSTVPGSPGGNQPLWYIRLNHTRLTDAVLDLCDVGQEESLRRFCCHILTRFTAPSPNLLTAKSETVASSDSKRSGRNGLHIFEKLNALLEDAVSTHGMSTVAAKKLSVFVKSCLPLPPNAFEAIDILQDVVVKLKSLVDGRKESRRDKRLEDAAKSLGSLRSLMYVLNDLNLGPLNTEQKKNGNQTSQPLYISIDLGLNQRRKHYHGGTIFQCISLPNNFFQKVDPNEHNELIIAPSGRGIKIAEGGNYSDLVRKNRPPGNFISSVESQYTAARIPFCVGVRFSVGSIVEMVYLAATISGQNSFADGNGSSGSDILQRGTEKQNMELFRRSLGHPMQFSSPIRVIVASVHGMDEASASERLLVAARLWNSGIAAEYLPQSGVALSLINRLHKESGDVSGSSDWSLLELQGVCALLRIPFIAIVQPHLLKEKSSVRLRQVSFDSIPQGPNVSSSNISAGGFSEAIVSLDNLASSILGASGSRGAEDFNEDIAFDNSGPATGSRETRSGFRVARVKCIFVDNDQYISSTRDVSKNETPHYKNTLKAMKTVKHAAESFLSSLPDPATHAEMGLEGIPVFAVTEVSFFILREMGTEIMRREKSEMSAAGACAVMIEKYPKHKRVLRTLSVAIDNFMKQSHNFWSSSGDPSSLGEHHQYSLTSSGSSLTSTLSTTPSFSSSLITVLLYSKVDDRFDMMTLHTSNKPKTSQRTSSGYVTSSARRR
jgi:hypothetical protein